MTWTNFPNEQEIMRSEAVESREIAESLYAVFERMTENKSANNASEAKAMLFVINAKNGFIEIAWWDHEAQTPMGDKAYGLQLKTLWEEEDAFDFEKACWNAVYDFTEDYIISDTGEYLYDIYTEIEISVIQKVLI